MSIITPRRILATAPQLFASAHGRDPFAGEHSCHYCGAPCGEEYPTATWLKNSFTGRAGVAAPTSDWVCVGCSLSLSDAADITMIDGATRTAQKVRGYSWVLTPTVAWAATKAHREVLLGLCLDPPEPPFALILSDSGQTHQVYRGVVNRDRSIVTATLEGAPISYRAGERPSYQADELASRVALCARLAAATGKPALSGPIDASFAIRVMQYWRDGSALLALWSQKRQEPVTRLAVWLTPSKEECIRDYPSDQPGSVRATDAITTTPAADDHRYDHAEAAAGNAGRPGGAGDQRARAAQRPRDRHQARFDFGAGA